MGKKIAIGVLLLLLLGGGLFFLTPNRYRVALKNYLLLSRAKTLAVEYSLEIGSGDPPLEVYGSISLDRSTDRSLTTVALAFGSLGERELLTIYQEGGSAYHKFNLPFASWSKGSVPVAEGADPARLSSLWSKENLAGFLRLLTQLERSHEENLQVFSTSTLWTKDELKALLSKLLGWDSEAWTISSYDFRMTFRSSDDLLQDMALKITHSVHNVVVESRISLTLVSLNGFMEISVPEGLPQS